MKVNGVMLREALKRWEMRREAAVKRFEPSFFAKPSDIAKKVNSSPDEVMKEFERCEDAVASLQAVQARYNLETKVVFQFNGKEIRMSLTEAVKRIGGAGRAESMWRQASMQPEDPNEDRKYMFAEKNIEWQTRVMSLSDSVERAANAALFAGALRGAIAVGNTREVDMDINPALFE